MKRREMLSAMGLGALAATLPLRLARADSHESPRDTTDASTSEAADDGINLLFVQNAHSAKLENGVLTLSQVGASTLYFSDRPERVTGHVGTDVFLEHWTDGGEDSFENDPPNAVLSVLGTDEPTDVVVVLSKPRLSGSSLRYDVEILDGATSVSGGASSLFIDSYEGPMETDHYRGRHRRVRRHRAHRRHRARRRHN